MKSRIKTMLVAGTALVAMLGTTVNAIPNLPDPQGKDITAAQTTIYDGYTTADGSTLKALPAFDVAEYKAGNADVAALGSDDAAITHYLAYGWDEHRLAGPDVYVPVYWATNPDVKAVVDALPANQKVYMTLYHFAKYGFKENRIGAINDANDAVLGRDKKTEYKTWAQIDALAAGASEADAAKAGFSTKLALLDGKTLQLRAADGVTAVADVTNVNVDEYFTIGADGLPALKDAYKDCQLWDGGVGRVYAYMNKDLPAGVFTTGKTSDSKGNVVLNAKSTKYYAFKIGETNPWNRGTLITADNVSTYIEAQAKDPQPWNHKIYSGGILMAAYGDTDQAKEVEDLGIYVHQPWEDDMTPAKKVEKKNYTGVNPDGQAFEAAFDAIANGKAYRNQGNTKYRKPGKDFQSTPPSILTTQDKNNLLAFAASTKASDKNNDNVLNTTEYDISGGYVIRYIDDPYKKNPVSMSFSVDSSVNGTIVVEYKNRESYYEYDKYTELAVSGDTQKTYQPHIKNDYVIARNSDVWDASNQEPNASEIASIADGKVGGDDCYIANISLWDKDGKQLIENGKEFSAGWNTLMNDGYVVPASNNPEKKVDGTWWVTDKSDLYDVKPGTRYSSITAVLKSIK